MTERAPDGTTYEVRGPKGAPLVVLIHGLGLNRHLWQSHEAALSPSYRVLKYDLLGHGEGPRLPETLSLTSFSEQLRGLLDHLHERSAALVGFSLGGMINRRFAIDYPDRAEALAILNSPHEREPQAQKIVEEQARQALEEGPEATIDGALTRWFTPEFQANCSEMVERIRARVLSNDRESYGRCREILATGVKELIRPEPPISKPTLVMTGENDSGSTPAMSRMIASEIPGAETIIVPSLQHMGLIEQPSRFTEPLQEFLDRTLN